MTRYSNNEYNEFKLIIEQKLKKVYDTLNYYLNHIMEFAQSDSIK